MLHFNLIECFPFGPPTMFVGRQNVPLFTIFRLASPLIRNALWNWELALDEEEMVVVVKDKNDVQDKKCEWNCIDKTIYQELRDSLCECCYSVCSCTNVSIIGDREQWSPCISLLHFAVYEFDKVWRKIIYCIEVSGVRAMVKEYNESHHRKLQAVDASGSRAVIHKHHQQLYIPLAVEAIIYSFL